MERHTPTLIALIVLLAIMPGLKSHAQQVVLNDNLFDALEHVITLNDEHKYLEAYRAVITVDRDLDQAMLGYQVSQLDDSDFELLYWPVKKSRAEVAYKLGLYNEMAVISARLDSALVERTDMEQTRREGMRADLLKIDGGRFFLTRNFDEAVTALQKALELKPFDAHFTAIVHDDLAQNYYAMGQYAKALAQLDTVLSTNPRFSADYRDPATNDERMEIESQRALCMARMGQFKEALNIIMPIVKHYKSGDQRRYAEALRKQGKIMMLQYDATGQFNKQAQHCYSDYLDVMRSYIDSHFLDMSEDEREQFWLAEQPFVTDCYRLEDKDSEMLYDVALFSKAVLLQMGREFTPEMTRAERQQVLSSMRVQWRDVQRSLPNDAAAIEFVNYQKGGERDHIAALVITKSATKPTFIPIATVDSILGHMTSTGKTVRDIISSTNDPTGNDAMYADSTLSALIWNQDLTRALGKSSKVYFAADGIFHALAVEYLSPDTLTNYYRLTSTRMLTQSKRDLNTGDMLMCAGVDFNKSCQTSTRVDNDAIAYSIMASNRVSLLPLDNSFTEMDSIMTIRGYRASDMILQKDSVNEAIVRQLMQRYHIVHFATHGKSSTAISGDNDLRPASRDTQLSQSCLFLSGALSAIYQPQFDASQADGILSARELAGMDLNHVDLAVLSACLTGRGDISTDGVYGLQRGLKAAGVQSIIVSLWEVEDRATNRLMTYLYRYLEEGMPLHEAFEKARKSLREYTQTSSFRGKTTMKQPFNYPHNYDAFILIDGI